MKTRVCQALIGRLSFFFPTRRARQYTPNMVEKAPKTSRSVLALVVGLAATLFVTACHLWGLDERAELMALNYRFAHFSSAKPDPNLVVVEIDDFSLEKLGRWPWPREVTAGIVDVLHDCGARAVALDVIMSEPQETRYVVAQGEIHDPDTAPIMGAARPREVFDDSIFADVLRRNRVILPMHTDPNRTDLGPEEETDEKVRSVLRDDPNASFATVARIVANASLETSQPKPEVVARLYWRNRGLHALRRLAIPPERTGDYPAESGLIFPPLVRFAGLCSGSGFVSFSPEADGVVRRMPLLAKSGQDYYPHFALMLAGDMLTGGKPVAVRADRSQVRLDLPKNSQRTIPVDPAGRLLINWVPGRHGGFKRLAAYRAGDVWQLRQKVEDNRRLARILGLRLAQLLAQTDLLKLFGRADEIHMRTRIPHEVQRQRAILYDPANVPTVPEGLAEAERDVEAQIEQAILALLEDLDFLIGGVPKESPVRKEVERLAATITNAFRAVQEHHREIEQKIEELKDKFHLEGKTCIIGSTATGAADFVPTPIHPRMPGVRVHANIINTIVSGVFVTEAHWAVNVAAILLAGAVVTLLTARLPVLKAGPLVLLLAGAYVAANLWVVFGAGRYWLILVAPMAAVVAAFLVVTAYRQMTEERAKRHIRGLFSHALSPVLVDRLLVDPSLLEPGARVLSCYFSDLAKFTPLAERLGERGTVELLNHYFDRMTEVIQNRYEGYINKFLGDGILGLFGAPVPKDDHARLAMGAAVATQVEVAELNETQVAQFGDWVQLSCRIGIATGSVMVGNCGSTERWDYTSIGDSVNLASRLESANKQFGTRIFVDERTWREGDDGTLLARPMGGVVVVGMSKPVGVWNIVGPMESAGEELKEALGRFAEGVELFRQRQFNEAIRAFEAVLAQLPDDGPSRVYISLCQSHILTPPPEDWNQAITLTEK